MGIKCEICGKEYSKMGIGTHIWRTHGDGILHDPNIGFKNGTKKQIWNKGLSKKESPALMKASVKLSETVKMKIKNGTYLPIKWSEEFRQKQSSKMSTFNPGGKCKWFDFKKENGEIVKLQGTWEVRFAKILEKIDPLWIKPSLGNKEHSFEWTNERKYTYTPDFWSPKFQTYFEVKGYWWGNDKEKMELVKLQNENLKVIIIQRKELELLEKILKI